MVFITIVTQKNGETEFFEEAFPKVYFMRLVSCSLYNSWHNLTRVGQMTFKTTKTNLAEIPQCHYTVKSLVNELTKCFKINKNASSVSIETYNPNSVLKMSLTFETNNRTEEIKVSHALARLIGTCTTLGQDEYIKKLNCPSTYCKDVMDRTGCKLVFICGVV